MESAKYSLNKIDLKKTLTHLAVYAVGFGAIAGLEELGKINLGDYQEIVGLLVGFAIDGIRKFLQGK